MLYLLVFGVEYSINTVTCSSITSRIFFVNKMITSLQDLNALPIALKTLKILMAALATLLE